MAVKPLVLVLDGQTDRLKAALRQGTSTLMDFSKSTEQVLDEIQQKVNDSMQMSGADLANRLTQNITRQVSGWKRGAEAALAMGQDYNPLGGMNSAKTLEAAAAQDRLAASYREQAAAAAAATGADKIEEVVLRQLAASSAYAGKEAERRAEELRVQASVFAAVERQMGITINTQGRLTQMTGATRNAMRDLSFQVSDVATSLAGGMPPAMVFSQQFGQIVGALQMAEGGGNKFVKFLAGPWGLALSTAAVAVVPLIAHLLEQKSALEENADALEKVKVGNDGLSEAQGVLGKMFDLTTGKLKDQNEMLRLNARLTAAKLRAEGLADEDAARKAKGQIGNNSIFDFGPRRLTLPALQRLEGDRSSGKITNEQAMVAARKLNFDGTGITFAQYNEMLIKGDEAKLKQLTADKIDKTLDTGVLDSAFVNPTKGRKPRVDHSAERDAEAEKKSDAAYDEAYAEALAEQAKLAREGVTDLQELADLEKKAVLAARAKQARTTEEEGRQKQWDEFDIMDLQTQQGLVTYKKTQAIDAKLQHDLYARDIASQENGLRFANQMLEIQGQLAPTLKERFTILRQVLANEKEAAVLAVKKDVNDKRISGDEGAKRIGDLDTLYAAKDRELAEKNLSPMAAYRKQLKSSTADIDSSLESVKVDGLKGLEDGLVGVISGTESAATAFKRMAASIIADLARIAIQQAFVKVLGFGLASGGKIPARAAGGLVGYNTGGLPGYAGGVRLSNGMISGPGTGTSDSILALVDGKRPIAVSNDEGIVNARAVKNYWPMIDAMNKGTFPRFAEGGLPGAAAMPSMANLAYPKIPSAKSLAPAGQTVHQHYTLNAPGGILANDLIAELDSRSARYASTALAAAPGLTRQQMAQRAEQRIT